MQANMALVPRWVWHPCGSACTLHLGGWYLKLGQHVGFPRADALLTWPHQQATPGRVGACMRCRRAMDRGVGASWCAMRQLPMQLRMGEVGAWSLQGASLCAGAK